MKAGEICTKAATLVGGDREKVHGEKGKNFGNIARMWNAYLGIRKEREKELTATDVAIMAVLMKVARTQSGEFNIDDFVDIAGYAGCAGELGGREKDD